MPHVGYPSILCACRQLITPSYHCCNLHVIDRPLGGRPVTLSFILFHALHHVEITHVLFQPSLIATLHPKNLIYLHSRNIASRSPQPGGTVRTVGRVWARERRYRDPKSLGLPSRTRNADHSPPNGGRLHRGGHDTTHDTGTQIYPTAFCTPPTHPAPPSRVR